jgi:alpha,alpha-trehalase
VGIVAVGVCVDQVSQPPLLSRMVRAVYSESADLTLVEQALPVLFKEHNFWTTEPHEVVIQDSQKNKHRLSRYYAHWNSPRPESCTIDKAIAKGLSKRQQAELYHNIATAAESGWDFSSRWMEDHQNLITLRTSAIIPVDLNAFLLQMELDIVFLARVAGDHAAERHYTKAANARRLAINSILWNEEMGQWFDYWLPLNNSEVQSVDMQKVVYDLGSGRLNLESYASNFVPLWCGMLPPGDAKGEKVLRALSNSGLLHPGGIATSVRETGEQWDFPNAWAPLQHMIIEGLATLNSEKANKLAQDISRRWLKSNYVAFEKTGRMVEKYDARSSGKIGGGGEYETQTGFGWTNGVALALLHDYGWAENQPITSTYNLIPWFPT